MSNIVSTALRSISGRRVAKEQQHSLDRESNGTRTSVLDVEAALDRYPDRVTSELSRIWAAARRF